MRNKRSAFASPTCHFEETPIQRAGSSEDWSTVLEIGNHEICSRIPLSFRFVTVRSMPLFFTRTEKRPISQRKSLCEICYLFRIRKAFIVISPLGPIDVVEHRHADDPIFKFFRSCLTNCYSYLNLFETLQCGSSENTPLEFKWIFVDSK